MNKPFVSVLIPVYNVATYLEQCLDSVLAQDLKELEIICINDGSTDASPEILQRYAERCDRIKLINRANGGYGSAVNLALSHATGEYVIILEPDDYIASDMYSSLYAHACAHGKPDIVKSGWWGVYEDPEFRMDRMPTEKPSIKGTFTVHEFDTILIWHPSVWSCMYKKEFLDAHNIRMVEAKGAGWVDNPFMFETLCRAKSICFLDRPLYYYRVFSSNSSSIIKDCSIPVQRINEILDFIDREKIRDPKIVKHAYLRALIYLRTMNDNPHMTEENIQSIRKMVKRFDRSIILNLTPYWYQWYNKYCGYFSRIPRPCFPLELRIRKAFSLIRRSPQIIKKYGVVGAFKKLVKKVFKKA